MDGQTWFISRVLESARGEDKGGWLEESTTLRHRGLALSRQACVFFPEFARGCVWWHARWLLRDFGAVWL